MADDCRREDEGPGGSGVPDGAAGCGERALDMVRLIGDHYGPLYRYAYRLTGSQADAEDLTQQTFLVAQQKWRQVREPDKVDRWLLAILRSCYLKGKRKRRPVAAASLSLDVDSIPEETPTSGQIDRQQLESAVNELPGEFKVVLAMFYFERLSYKEIAKQLDIPIGTVMSRLSRAKGRLRRRLLDVEAPQERPAAREAARGLSTERPIAAGSTSRRSGSWGERR